MRYKSVTKSQTLFPFNLTGSLQKKRKFEGEEIKRRMQFLLKHIIMNNFDIERLEMLRLCTRLPKRYEYILYTYNIEYIHVYKVNHPRKWLEKNSIVDCIMDSGLIYYRLVVSRELIVSNAPSWTVRRRFPLVMFFERVARIQDARLCEFNDHDVISHN